MSGEFFLDSNVFIYTFDDTAPHKQQVAQELVTRALRDGSGAISHQVVQEVLNVLTRKLLVPMSSDDAMRYLMLTLEPLWKVGVGAALFQSALSIQTRYRFGFHDSLIVAAALTADCAVLYSEDLQHGQRIEGLTVENPFRQCVIHEQQASYEASNQI
jgi:predicted nucleic acid-binding protein